MKRILLPLFIFLFILNSGFAQTKTTGATKELVKGFSLDSVHAARTDSPAVAVLHFYRSFIPWAVAPIKKVPIFVNDTLLHLLKANTMVTFTITRFGKYTISTGKKSDDDIVVKILPGKDYYFSCDVTLGLWGGKPRIMAVTPAQAAKELANGKGVTEVKELQH